MYEYRATVVRVIDGDTVELNVDQGFHDWKHNQSFRIAGISARELSMPGGKEAKENLKRLLTPPGVYGLDVVIRSVKSERDPADAMSFDRYVVHVALTARLDTLHSGSIASPQVKVSGTIMETGIPLPSIEGTVLTDLGQILIATQWAMPWDGKSKPIPYPAWPRDNYINSMAVV